MYIQKEVLTDYGIPAVYHVLKEIHTYYDDGVSHINVAGYFSKDAFNNRANAVIINQVEINQTTFENEKDIYNAVLSTIVFQDGVLCEVESNIEESDVIVDEIETVQN
jgi:hypothetical protein